MYMHSAFPDNETIMRSRADYDHIGGIGREIHSGRWDQMSRNSRRAVTRRRIVHLPQSP